MGFGGQLPGGADLNHNNFLVVDVNFGDDSTGERNNESKPYATIAGAYVDFLEGDLIHCRAGASTETGIVFGTKGATVSRVDIDFEEGWIQTAAVDNVKMFNDTGVQYHIHGRGEFIQNGLGFGGAVSIFEASSLYFIHGAKSIIATVGSPIGIRFGNIENIDLIEAIATTAINVSVEAPTPRNGRDLGNIKNVKLIKGTIGMFFAMASAIEIINVINCNIEGASNYAYFGGDVDNKVKFINCTFLVDGVGLRAAFIMGAEHFINCAFQNDNSSIECVWIDDETTNNPTATFENCTFQNTSNGVALISRGSAKFSGTNRFVGNEATSGSVTGYITAENYNSGTIIVSNPDLIVGSQIWWFSPTEDPPTVGEIYTITAPDADTISYTVLALDTIDDVITGLFDAWVAKALLGNNEFENWTPVNQPLPTGRLQVTAVDDIYNMDVDNGFVSSTSGTDTFPTSLPINTAFALVGPGKFIVDENLVIPIL